MAGAVYLHGGGELDSRCVPGDRAALALAPEGSLVVLAGASAPGGDDARTTQRAVRHFSALTDRWCLPAPHPQSDPAGAAAAVSDAAVVVLTGGSPARLVAGLAGEVGEAVRAAWERGALVIGCSAGAMVLAEATLLPDEPGRPVVPGLGLVQGVACLVHYSGPRPEWEQQLVAADRAVFGLPECSGVLVTGEGPLASRTIVAVGAHDSAVVLPQRRITLSLGTSISGQELA